MSHDEVVTYVAHEVDISQCLQFRVIGRLESVQFLCASHSLSGDNMDAICVLYVHNIYVISKVNSTLCL